MILLMLPLQTRWQMNELAVVIPAYKAAFLESTLQSLADQTDKRFTVYIGDDNSPNNLQPIVEKFKAVLDIQYHRFQNNIGAKHLVHQWNRCVALTRNEKWIWLFSDDDTADTNCVETFYKTVEQDNNRFDVYRFDTRVIDQKNKVLEETPESPFTESSLHMAINLLRFKRGNSIVDHIFSKAVYTKCNGFVYTDYAQGADWASSVLFSRDKGICTMPGAKVNWRLSGQNISGKAAYTNEMLLGHLQFCNWLKGHFACLKQGSPTCYKALEKHIDMNLRQVIRSHYKGLYFYMYKDVFRYYAASSNAITALLLTARLYSLIRLRLH